jgi:predicted MFS family arabinose efflux permease
LAAPTKEPFGAALLPQQDQPIVYVRYVIVLLTVVNVFNYMDRMALAVLAPSIKRELALTDAQLGLLSGLAFSLFYAICGIPIARWADRGIRRDLIALALGTWSFMTMLSGAAQNYWHLLLARMGVGSGEAGCVPAAQSLLCDYVPFERRPGVLAFHNSGLVAGAVIGMALAGWLGDIIGWRWTFVLLGAPGIALAVVVKLTVREPLRGRFDSRKEDPTGATSLLKTLAATWRCRTYRLLVVYSVLLGFTQYGLVQWLPSMYSRSFALEMSSVGLYLGIAMGVGSGIGLLIGGLLGNRAARRDVRRPLIIGGVAMVLALPAIVGSLLVASGPLSMVLVTLAVLLWSITTGPILAALYSVIAPRMRATAGAALMFFTSAIGFGLGPLCAGLLSDWLTPLYGIDALRYALLAPASLLPLSALALFVAARSLPDDLRASVT